MDIIPPCSSRPHPHHPALAARKARGLRPPRHGGVASKERRGAGVAVLDAGGNAIDAALAAALALAAIEPWNSGLEGIDDAVIPSGRSG